MSRRYGQWSKQAERSPYDAERDPSFAALPNLIVIDGGKGQLAAGLEALHGFRERGVAVVSSPSGSRRCSCPATPHRSASRTTRPSCRLLQRVRDEAATAITHHRVRRDRAMTESIMDDLPGIGPARKRVLLSALRSPDAVLAASRTELERVPDFQKVRRDLTLTSTRPDDERERPRPIPPRGLRDHLRAVRRSRRP